MTATRAAVTVPDLRAARARAIETTASPAAGSPSVRANCAATAGPCRLDPGRRERGKEPQPGLGGIEFYVVDQRCRAGRRLQLVADGCQEGPDLPVDRQPAGWLEDGHLETLGTPARDGTGLAVSG